MLPVICDLYSMFWGGMCEEALFKWDNGTWSKGSPLVGGTLCPDLTSFIHCALPVCTLLFNAIPIPIPSLDSVHFLSAVSEAGGRWRSWPGRLGWRRVRAWLRACVIACVRAWLRARCCYTSEGKWSHAATVRKAQWALVQHVCVCKCVWSLSWVWNNRGSLT